MVTEDVGTSLYYIFLCHFVPCEQELVLHVCSWCQRLGGNTKYMNLVQSINCHLVILGEFSICPCCSNGQFGITVCGQKHCWKFLAPDCIISDLGLLSMVKKTKACVHYNRDSSNELIWYSDSPSPDNVMFIAARCNIFFHADLAAGAKLHVTGLTRRQQQHQFTTVMAAMAVPGTSTIPVRGAKLALQPLSTG